MADPNYVNIGSNTIKLIEECGELIQAVCKGDRFGWQNKYPDKDSPTNLEILEYEFEDLIRAFNNLKEEILNGE